VVSGAVYLLEYRLLRWRLSGKEVEGDRIWKNLRRFSAWILGSSVAGVIAFAALLMARDFIYDSFSAISRRQFYELQVSAAAGSRVI
jgi:hypothetical protein